MVDNAQSVGVLRCSKNPVDARNKNIQQRAESLSLAGALEGNNWKLRLDWTCGTKAAFDTFPPPFRDSDKAAAVVVGPAAAAE